MYLLLLIIDNEEFRRDVCNIKLKFYSMCILRKYTYNIYLKHFHWDFVQMLIFNADIRKTLFSFTLFYLC